MFGKLHAVTWLDSIGIVARKMTRIRNYVRLVRWWITNLVIQKFKAQLSVCNQDFPPCRHTLSCRSSKNLYVWSSGQPLGPFLCGGLQFMAFCWQNGAATAGRPGPSDFEKILGLFKKRAMLVEPLSVMRASKHSRHEEHLSAMMGWEAGKYGKGMKGVSSR